MSRRGTERQEKKEKRKNAICGRDGCGVDGRASRARRGEEVRGVNPGEERSTKVIETEKERRGGADLIFNIAA